VDETYRTVILDVERILTFWKQDHNGGIYVPEVLTVAKEKMVQSQQEIIRYDFPT
jgi:hypothetical protein